MTETSHTDAPPAAAQSPGAARAVLPACARAAAILAAVLVLTAPSAFAVLGPAGVAPAPSVQAASLPPPSQPVKVASADRLARLFDRLGYHLEAVGEDGLPVPSIELAALPEDLDEIRSTDERKALFIRAVLPVVLRASEAVLVDRAVLEAMIATLEEGRGLGRHDLEAFRRLAERYAMPEAAADLAGMRALLPRVDVVPASLAVAQAIKESGWGTSRFARTGNALFGQWTWDPAAGILPVERPAGRSHRVRAFRNLADSAQAYLFNLNTHPAYEGFRKARAAARAETGSLPEAHRLAGHLTRYSERRQAYVQEIVDLIRHNRLDRLDDAVLGEPSQYADADPVAAGLVDG